MGLFDFLKKSSVPKDEPKQAQDKPYANSTTNFMYELLFCDNLEWYKVNTIQPYRYPFDVLFSEPSTVADLQKLINAADTESRIKLLAYNRLRAEGKAAEKKELLAVIVEVALEDGLDVLAAFADGTARYINQSGKLLIWENGTDAKANELIGELFARSRAIVDQIGPWEEKRKPPPPKRNTRITFLVSDGLYFGEAETSILFGDRMAGGALNIATKLLQYLTESAETQNTGRQT